MKTNTSLAFLNWGQSFIFTTGLTSIMLLASQQILAGACSLFLLVLILSFPFVMISYSRIIQFRNI